MQADSKVSRAIAEWQEKLLQLDRRNRLLYFREGRQAVPIRDAPPDQVNTWIDGTPRPWCFSELEEEHGRSRKTRAPKVMTTLEPQELRRRLRALHRRDREWKEEQGIPYGVWWTGFWRTKVPYTSISSWNASGSATA